MLKPVKYKWDENFGLISSLTCACKLVNDTVIHRFPIHVGLLEMTMFEIGRIYQNQPYLNI